MRGFDSTTLALLAEGRAVDRGMILFDLGSGLYGFWTGIGTLTYGGTTYVGGGSLLEVSPIPENSTGESVPVTIRLASIPDSPLTPEVLRTIEEEVYHQRPVYIMTAYFHPDTHALLTVDTEYHGKIDQIVHIQQSGAESVLEVYCESKARDNTKTGYRTRSHEDQLLIDSTDVGLEHTSQTAILPIYWGQDDPEPPEA